MGGEGSGVRGSRRAPRAMNWPDWAEFGPKMRALTEKQRRFVWAYLTSMVTDGKANATQAAIDCGYADNSRSKAAGQRGYKNMQNERVLDAMAEVGARELRGLVIPAVASLGRMVRNRGHADHRKAVEMVLNRTGFAERTEHTVSVEHRMDPRQQEELVRRLAEELGVPVAKLLGANAPALEAPGAEIEIEAIKGV